MDWIESLGPIKECKSCKEFSKKEYFEKNFVLSWTQDVNVFSNELCQKLKYIEENRFQGNSFYIATTNHDNIAVRNEPKYEDFDFPNENYRLLSLFRFWNTIEYFFPYKYLTDQNWNEVLSEMIPKFKNAKNATEYHLAILETVIKLDDTHANFYTPKIHSFFGYKYIPAYFKVIDEKVVITGYYNDSLAKLNDLKIGDVIEKMEGKSLNELIVDRKKYVNGSNNSTKSKNYDFTIFNGSNDSVNLTIRRDNELINRKIGRGRYDEKVLLKPIQNPEKYKIINDNIGYINMASLEMKDVDGMMDKIKATKGIIIDLRNYPNFNPYMIAKRLIQTEKAFSRLTSPDVSYPGKFILGKPKTITPYKEFYKGKVILLVNEETQSAAEYSTMILQAGDNVTTIGSQTAGADGDMTIVEFIGFKCFMSGLGVYYPDGTETQRNGVKIDIEVKPTIEGIRNGKDEVLEKALELLK